MSVTFVHTAQHPLAIIYILQHADNMSVILNILRSALLQIIYILLQPVHMSATFAHTAHRPRDIYIYTAKH
jgi:hypothetical protein